jgi:hypothetical protein
MLGKGTSTSWICTLSGLVLVLIRHLSASAFSQIPQCRSPPLSVLSFSAPISSATLECPSSNQEQQAKPHHSPSNTHARFSATQRPLMPIARFSQLSNSLVVTLFSHVPTSSAFHSFPPHSLRIRLSSPLMNSSHVILCFALARLTLRHTYAFSPGSLRTHYLFPRVSSLRKFPPRLISLPLFQLPPRHTLHL